MIFIFSDSFQLLLSIKSSEYSKVNTFIQNIAFIFIFQLFF
ncbi:hypothetical protein RV03_GL001531 [Enterococcus gallinarum]|nr:hypothetical protein RV03_GL001531 [Enterococcus gallinarum]